MNGDKSAVAAGSGLNYFVGTIAENPPLHVVIRLT
jgi:hypothetical protein